MEKLLLKSNKINSLAALEMDIIVLYNLICHLNIIMQKIRAKMEIEAK